MKRSLLLLVSIGLSQITDTHTLEKAADLHSYIWANYQQYGRNQKEATFWYNISTNSSRYAYKGYIIFLFEQRKYTEIVSLISKLSSTFEKDPVIQRIFAHSLLSTGHQKEAITKFITLNQQFKDDPEIAFQTVQIYLGKKEPENAITVLDTFLNKAVRKPTDCIFYFLKAQSHLLLSQLDAAHQAAQKSVELQSQFDKGWLMLALLDEQAGRIKDAINGYTRFLEVTMMPKQAIQQRLFQLALVEHKSGLHASLHPAEYYQKAKDCFNKGDFKNALEMIKKCTPGIAKQPIDYHILHINILIALGNYDEALSIIQTEALQEKKSHAPWLKMLHLFSYQLPHEKISNTFNALEEKCSHNCWFYLYQADSNLRARNSDLALKNLDAALNLIKKPSLKGKILFQKSVIYFEQQAYPQMLESLQAAQTIIPNFSPVLNLLAYYYATKGHDLARAQELIDTALALDPTNPHILDTKAVILYKKRDYVQADAILTQIRNNTLQDATILIHHAKVLYALQKKDLAQETLQQAHLHARYEHELRSLRKSQEKWQQKLGTSPVSQEGT